MAAGAYRRGTGREEPTKTRCSEDQVDSGRVVNLAGMYLRRCYRAKDGKRHAYWALVKSVRTQRGPRQQVVAYLGELDEQGRLGVIEAAGQRPPDGQGQLFAPPAS